LDYTDVILGRDSWGVITMPSQHLYAYYYCYGYCCCYYYYYYCYHYYC